MRMQGMNIRTFGKGKFSLFGLTSTRFQMFLMKFSTLGECMEWNEVHYALAENAK
jgi:hypothetical protein